VALLQPVLILDGHQGMVKGVAVSADGKLIASGSSDWKVRLFDGISGEVLHIMEHHRDWVYSVDFSPDGRFLVSGGRDRAVQLWDTDSGERVTGVRTTAELYRVDFSPDGTRFAGAGFYSAIGHVWNLDGAEVFPLEGHTTRLRTVAYSQEGGWLGTADGEGLVLIRDAATGEPLYQAQVSGEALALAFLRGTNWLAVGTSRGEVVIFDVESGEVIQSWFAHSAGIGEVIASPDGALLISAGPDAAVRLWDPESGVRLASLSGHGVAVNGVAISSDGSTLVSGGNDGRVFVWRVGSSP
jgi:WD40 repeat protein